jgi:hypothetical protein
MKLSYSLMALLWLVPIVVLQGAELEMLSPRDYQVVQRSATGDGTLSIIGRLSENVPSNAIVEVKLSDRGKEAVWKRLDARIGGRDFTAALEAQSGGWYRLEIRVSSGDAEVARARVEHVGVGEVFVIAGQSNSANHGEVKLSPMTDRVVAFDGLNWTIANDPQPGASGKSGSFIPALGDVIVENRDGPVGIVACGVGATSVREWLPKGSRFANPPTLLGRVEQAPNGEWFSKGEAFDVLVERMKKLGPYGFRAVLWHQGESDANQKDPSRTLAGNLYREYLEKIIRESRSLIGWHAPWFVAQASYHVPGDESSPDIRQAQASLWKDGIAWEGPDTDALKGELRERNGQGVHFSAKGLRVHGERWSEKILARIIQSIDSRIVVQSDFEGGNIEVVQLDQASQRLRVMPAIREGRGWPCWWSMKVTGLRRGTELTLEVQSQTRPYSQGKVLANTWCQPRHAWISDDGGVTWLPSPRGELNSDKQMVYKIPASRAELSIAWGPPFVTSDAEELLQRIADRFPESKRFELAKTREGRPVNGIRVGSEKARFQVWVNARQHAWEAGGSHVGRGLMEWITSDDPAALALQRKTCIHFIPIMDVDNVVIGAGGKEAQPRDHNRDWADEPIYPEVVAAQTMIRSIQESRGLDVYIDLHNPGPRDPVFFFGPFGYTELQGTTRRNYQRWIEFAAKNIREPVPVIPEYRFATYVTTEEERGRMSSGWVRHCIKDHGISVTLETGWDNLAMSVSGYASIGAGLGRTLAEYLTELDK